MAVQQGSTGALRSRLLGRGAPPLDSCKQSPKLRDCGLKHFGKAACLSRNWTWGAAPFCAPMEYVSGSPDTRRGDIDAFGGCNEGRAEQRVDCLRQGRARAVGQVGDTAGAAGARVLLLSDDDAAVRFRSSGTAGLHVLWCFERACVPARKGGGGQVSRCIPQWSCSVRCRIPSSERWSPSAAQKRPLWDCGCRRGKSVAGKSRSGSQQAGSCGCRSARRSDSGSAAARSGCGVCCP